MEKNSRSKSPIRASKWGAISLLENVAAYRKTHQKELKQSKIPKRIKTDFFPTKNVGRGWYREKTRFLLGPESNFKVFFDILKLLTIVTESIIIPYMLCFSPTDLHNIQYSIQIIEIFFLFDIILTFNTEVYFNGTHFFDRIFIAKKYLKSWFLFDVISTFPFPLFIEETRVKEGYLYISISGRDTIQFLWLMKLIRLGKVKGLVYSIEDFFVSSVFLSVIRGFKFLVTIFIWTHWLACCIYVTYIRALEEDSVLWNQYKENALDRYLRRFYLIIETMTSVGYGDILPRTQKQYIVTILSMSFACVLFGNIIGNIQGYIESYNAETKYYDTIARQLKSYIKKNNLSTHTKNRVVQYVYFIQLINKKNDIKDLDLLDTLSAPLREEIFTITRGYLLAKSSVFNCYSGSFLKYLGHQMKSEVFAPGDTIFKEGHIGSTLYYLCSGKVRIYHEKTKTVFKEIKVTKYFGEISFFLKKHPRTASAICTKFAEFLTLERNNFDVVLQSRPKEMEITKVIKYNCKKYKNLSMLGIRCYLCSVIGHVAGNCEKFVIPVDQHEIAAKAIGKKYINQVNLNECPVSTFPRLFPNGDKLKKYKKINSKGFKFTPGTMYVDNQQIINKAWNMQSGVSSKGKLSSIKESYMDSDENSSAPRHSDSSPPVTCKEITFGN